MMSCAAIRPAVPEVCAAGFGSLTHPPQSSQDFQVTPSSSSAGTHWQSTQFVTWRVCLQESPVFSHGPHPVLGHSWLP